MSDNNPQNSNQSEQTDPQREGTVINNGMVQRTGKKMKRILKK